MMALRLRVLDSSDLSRGRKCAEVLFASRIRVAVLRFYFPVAICA